MDEQKRFAVFEVGLSKRPRRKWKWSVCTNQGTVIMHGYEGTRPAASYKARSALFLLLASAPSIDPTGCAPPKRRVNQRLRSS